MKSPPKNNKIKKHDVPDLHIVPFTESVSIQNFVYSSEFEQSEELNDNMIERLHREIELEIERV